MNEKIYKTMGRVGGGNIAMGAVLVVAGVATGVLMIVSGAGLLKRRGEITSWRCWCWRKCCSPWCCRASPFCCAFGSTPATRP